MKSSRRESQNSVSSKHRGGSEKHKIESIVIDVKDKKTKKAMRKAMSLESVASRGLNENSDSDASSVKMQIIVPENIVPEIKNMKSY